MKYSDKLKDPRWQKMRLKVMERDNWECSICGCSEQTLHVHHDKYRGNPWESDPKDLVTLCETCHEIIEEMKSMAKAANPSRNFTAMELGAIMFKAVEMAGDNIWGQRLVAWLEMANAKPNEN